MQAGRSAVVNHAGSSVLYLTSRERCKTVQRSYAVYLVGATGLYFGPFCVGWLNGVKAIHARCVYSTTRNIIDSIISVIFQLMRLLYAL